MDITITVSVPPRWSDDKIKAIAAKAGNPWMAAAMRGCMLEMRHDYEAERLRLILRIEHLEAQAQPDTDGGMLAEYQAIKRQHEERIDANRQQQARQMSDNEWKNQGRSQEDILPGI